MGLFGGSKKTEPAVRRDKVMRLLDLGMKETDAADRDIDSKEFARAKAALEAEMGNCTQAELRAAHSALKRHGY